jgi:hypothetical protein
MVFDLDDPTSLERLLPIHCDFQESNAPIGAYQILLGLVTPDMIAQRTKKEVS